MTVGVAGGVGDDGGPAGGNGIERIARGSGQSHSDVRALLKQYKQSKKMVKMLKGMSGGAGGAGDEKAMQKMMAKMQKSGLMKGGKGMKMKF